METLVNTFLSKEEACSKLHVSLSTLERMLKRGDLNYTKIGKKVLISKTDLSQLINGFVTNCVKS